MATVTKGKGRAKTTDPRPEGQDRKVMYPELKMVCCIGDGSRKVDFKVAPAMTAKKMMKVLAWESEAEYQARMMSADPTAKPEQFRFPEIGEQLTGQDDDGNPRTATVLCKDETGQKIVCWNVIGNRHFDEPSCCQYIQDVLNRQWSGPSTGQATFNGETFVVGVSGRVESGQHRGVGLVRAWQRWKRHIDVGVGRWADLWPVGQYPDGPVMDVPIWFGISEDPRVIRTLDIGRRRTISDTIETSPIFEKLKPGERIESSKMLGGALKFLWQRTGTKDVSSFHEVQTPSEMMDLLDRHPRLQRCVLHILKCNSFKNGKMINNTLGPIAGTCSAIMYLMAAGNCDINDYRNAEPMPKESALGKMDLWDKAEQFWRDYAAGDGPHSSILQAITAAAAIDGKSCPTPEKLAIISKAWNVYKDGSEVGPSQCLLSLDEYQTDQHGKKSLASIHTFNASAGIDLGTKPKAVSNGPEDAEAEKAHIDAEKLAARQKSLAEKEAKVAAANKRKGINGVDLKAADDKMAKAKAALKAKQEREQLDRQPQEEVSREDLAELANGDLVEMDASDPGEEELEASGDEE